MFGLRRFGIKLGLEVIRAIMASLGNPQNRYAVVHVAGTNGKGSVASAVAAILQQAGYRTGLYTSPHLVRFNERIQVDRRPISDAAVVEAYRRVKKVAAGKREPTFFEFSTAMALYEFGRREVDWAVVETGMGGRLDATNIVRPRLSIITNISLEHREYLGSSIAAIAGEKAGIIKRRTPIVTGTRRPPAAAVIAEAAERRNAPIFRYGRDFRVRRKSDGRFDYFGIHLVLRDLTTGLQGAFQVDNAALALAGCEVLMRRGAGIDADHLREGLSRNEWPGRLETVAAEPLIMVDGAHNLAAARQLARHLGAAFGHRPITLVIGILDDKPYRAMLEALLPVCRRVVFTRAGIGRALPAETLAAAAKGAAAVVEVVDAVPRAVQRAVDTLPAGGVICIAGSLYVVGEATAAFAQGEIRTA